MRILYLDCFAGISGDMFLGALMDLGLSADSLLEKLSSLGPLGFEISAVKVVKNGIAGTKASIHIPDKRHHHRHLPDICNIIDNSTLPVRVKEKSKAVFLNLAHAEAKIHNTAAEKIHFHEVGAIDAIVDIVGVITGLEMLGVEKVICSSLPLGYGFVNCAHGTIPLPAPATLELLKGLPVKNCSIYGETVTPTGAALVKTICTEFGTMPTMDIMSIGYGAGEADREIPNLLRIVLGDTANEQSALIKDSLKIVEANIDDMNPEFFEHILPLVLESGAVDVYITPIIMKKGRPGQLLTSLVPEQKLDDVIKTILSESTTLGVRISDCNRYKLHRETTTVDTPYGFVTVKIGYQKSSDEFMNIAPEWEDCKKLAEQNNVPVKMIYDMAKAAFLNKRK